TSFPALPSSPPSPTPPQSSHCLPDAMVVDSGLDGDAKRAATNLIVPPSPLRGAQECILPPKRSHMLNLATFPVDPELTTERCFRFSEEAIVFSCDGDRRHRKRAELLEGVANYTSPWDPRYQTFV